MKYSLLRAMILLAISSLLASCGGGGGGGGGSSTPTSTPSQNFTVSLKAVDIRRVSNGESVDVNTTDIASDPLTYQP